MNFLISFGAFRAYIDQVRFITNRSMGTFGHAVLKEVSRRGYNARVVAGDTRFSSSQAANRWVHVKDYRQLKEALAENFGWADVLIMAAAVPDFLPQGQVAGKIPRRSGRLDLRLQATESILGALSRKRGRRGKLLIGFSLEKEAPIRKALQKLQEHRLDWMVAVKLDDRQPPFGANPLSIALVKAQRVERLPCWNKTKAAQYLLDKIIAESPLAKA